MLASQYLKEDYAFLKVGRVGATHSDITQKVVYVDEAEKFKVLIDLLLSADPVRTLIFVETKRGCDTLDSMLYQDDFPVTSIHGDRTQREREDALTSFRNGHTPIMVATAVAARGLDIKAVMHVINYDMPSDINEYVHRIGRTARAGNHGLATSFITNRSMDLAQPLTKLLVEANQVIPDFLKEYVPANLQFDEDEELPAAYPGRRGGGGGGGHGNNDGGYGSRDRQDRNGNFGGDNDGGLEAVVVMKAVSVVVVVTVTKEALVVVVVTKAVSVVVAVTVTKAVSVVVVVKKTVSETLAVDDMEMTIDATTVDHTAVPATTATDSKSRTMMAATRALGEESKITPAHPGAENRTILLHRRGAENRTILLHRHGAETKRTRAHRGEETPQITILRQNRQRHRRPDRGEETRPASKRLEVHPMVATRLPNKRLEVRPGAATLMFVLQSHQSPR